MLEWINSAVLTVMDPLLGWLLHLPSDLMLIIVAVGTGAILTFVRLWTTDQDLLGRCRDDRKRQKALIKEAKKRADKDAVRRHRATIGTVAMKAMKAEWRPLLAVIVPIALLGTWAFQRIACHPPKAAETVEVVVYFPVSAAGGAVAHMVPQGNVTAENGWVQPILRQQDVEPPDGEAVWKLRAAASEEPYDLRIRYRDGTYHRTLLVGQRNYAAPLEFYDDDQVHLAEVRMKKVKLFGVVPGIPFLFLEPWLVAYFLIAIPSVMLLKRVFHIL